MFKLFNLVALLLTTCYNLICLPSKTIYGDCNSSDEKKWFKSKTLIDGDNNGTYDTEVIKWCNDRITTRPYKGIMIGQPPLPFDPSNYAIHSLDSLYFTENNADLMFQFSIKREENGPIVAIEYKGLANDTIFTTIFEGVQNSEDFEFLKQQPSGFFDKERKLYFFQYYQFDNNSQILVTNYDYNNQNKIYKEYFDGPGWKVRVINFRELPMGNYYISVKQNSITHTSEIFKNQ
jgi:hypothetical protein